MARTEELEMNAQRAQLTADLSVVQIGICIACLRRFGSHHFD
jgi:hypothetical protein